MRILGIDPGLNLTGYGCIDITDPAGSTGEPRIIEAGVFRLSSKDSIDHRLKQLHTDCRDLLEELKPDVIVVEELFSHYRHVRTAILMGHARGVILLAGQLQNVEIDELGATEVKKAITGHGHASKEQMQLAVMAQFRLEHPPSPPDVADALAIALCAARRRMTADQGA